ncbi:MAG TPA: metal-dependent hydrolase, partial [Gaiellaceae bacterium]|nr:metal-dependent hydrolase [Gaiellaceae bacterium]
KVLNPNKGGTVEAAGIKFTLTNAFHSSSNDDGEYMGEPCGIVVEVENGTKLYFAGDTCVFGDMQLIARIYAPDVAILPIGDHFTMGPREAAVALELLNVKRCVPCHFGTFPPLVGTPAELRELAPDVQVEDLEPGGSVSL